jgi:SH3-like domain-containing protein
MPRLSLLIFIFLLISTSAYCKMLTVKNEKVPLMSGPAKSFQIKCEYDKGFPIKVTSTKGKWVKIEDFENDSGWIYRDFLIDHPSVIVKANRNTENKINLRSGPGESYKIIGQAFYGVVFEKIEQKNGWVKIRHDSGLTGWVKGLFLWGY